MAQFEYDALTGQGARTRGRVDAPTRIAALDLLHTRGLTPVSVEAFSGAKPWWAREVDLFGASRDGRRLVPFLSTLSMLLAAKLPLMAALRTSADQSADRKLKPALRRVIDRVADGQTLSGALGAESEVFPGRVRTLIEVGERANALEDAVARTAALLKAEAAFRAAIRSALLYPAVLLVMSLGVIGLILFQLVPTLVPVFDAAGAPLPASLSAMNAARVFLMDNGSVLLLILAGLGAGCLVWQRPLGRAIGHVSLPLPVLRPWIVTRQTLDLCRSVGLLLQSGASLPEALKATATATRHPRYRSLIVAARQTIEGGGTLSDGLAAESLVHPLARQLIPVGEASDRLGPILEDIAAALSGLLSERTERILKLVTPALTLALGLGIGALVLATITAILDLNDATL